MPAAATARKPAPRSARRAPAAARTATAPRRTTRTSAASARRSRPATRPQTGFVPVVVGRTAGAVGGLADSGVVFGLTRSRLWIGLLAGLLVGIVGLNVAALQFNASTSKTAALADDLKRENSALRNEITGSLSNERLQIVASRLGLVIPEPEAILNLMPRPGDAAAAAERLREGAITIGSTSADVPPAPPIVAPPVVADEAVADPAVIAAAPAPVDSATPQTAPSEETASTSAPAAPPAVASGGAVVP